VASIDKRPDGRYRARWREYPGGPQRSKHFARKIDAEQHLVRIQHDLLTGAYVDPAKARTTVTDYYESWRPRQPWRRSTRESVESTFKNHILPKFGSRPIGSIRRGDVESWAAALELGPRTATVVVQQFGTMLEGAVSDGVLAANPARRAKRPKVEFEPVEPLTLDEVEALRAASPSWFRVVVILGAAAGLRQAEATGLTVDRLNLLERSLTVDRQLVGVADGVPVFGPPKTSRSFRKVPLADLAVDELAAHLSAHGAGNDALVLHEHGRPVTRDRFGRIWRQIRKDAGLEEARFHDTRHTYASTLLSGGVSVAAAADYLGHSPAMLLNTYAHLMPADHERARLAIQAAFIPAAEDAVRTRSSRGCT
jgi:integrase